MTPSSVRTAFPPLPYARKPCDILAWTQRDYDVLQSLSLRIRIIALSQAMRVWWPGQRTERNARKRLRLLAAAGLLERYVINAHPLIHPNAPLFAWQPGAKPPNCAEVSGQARSRWCEAAVPTEVYAASKQAANLFGGNTYGLPVLEHRDHDLLLADAYAAYREEKMEVAARWIGEDFLPKAGFRIKDPDAFLVDDDGRPFCVVESAGRYCAKQVQSFHTYCASMELSYELW